MAITQYQRGDTAFVMAPVLTAQGVALGDLVGLSSGNVVRAEDETWDTSLAVTQAAFVAKFLGASAQRKTAAVARVDANSEDNVIRVSTAGVHEFDCASATFTVGQLVGPAKQSGNALESQKVVSVANETLAIGRVAEAGASITRVKVRLLSSKYPASRAVPADVDLASAIVSLTDNTGGSANDTLTALGGLTTLTDSTGLSGTHDDTLAATSVPTTLTDSTGLSGTHDDTLAATTVPGSLTVSDGVGTNDGTIGAITDNASTITAVQELAAKINATLTLLGVMVQNNSDTAQKVIEHNTLLGIMAQNDSDTAQKVIEVVADIEDCRNNFADIAAKVNAILVALRTAGVIAA